MAFMLKYWAIRFWDLMTAVALVFKLIVMVVVMVVVVVFVTAVVVLIGMLVMIPVVMFWWLRQWRCWRWQR